MSDLLVEPIMLARNKRGLRNIVRIAELVSTEEMVSYSGNTEQDVIEFKEALLWIERYCNWHDMRLRDQSKAQ